MHIADPVGQTLDGKYRIERELGRGGMGTVYLATHLGTERPVAVKVIAPQFMQRPEFVERFRREAKAAGRLRHPNVVDVTDFGFADTPQGRVAYLVMEYLDGCTLGEILEEERNLPVGWTLDILEQVCSAVHEAHGQGIIHRDLKPDNIWLEPNQRGGYTVKVLDFGIAKLETPGNNNSDDAIHLTPPMPSLADAVRATSADGIRSDTIADGGSETLALPDATMAADKDVATLISGPATGSPDQANNEAGTMLMPSTESDGVKTKIISPISDHGPSAAGSGGSASEKTAISETSDLTRAGAVLGTPLYMSPEQCRGEKLDARSDVYSLGVIAYQMLSGSPPFSGDFTAVMDAHREQQPPPLRVKNVRRKLKRVIQSALSKDPDNRPQTAEAFASGLRARSEGIAGLLRRAGMIYTEHISKFLLLSTLFYIPVIIFTVALIITRFLTATEMISVTAGNLAVGISAAGLTLATAFCATLITGTVTWVVIHTFAVPLRPIRIRSALRESKKKWKRFAGAGIMTTLFALGGAVASAAIAFGFAMLVFWYTVGMSGTVGGISAGIGALAGVTTFVVASVAFMLTVPVVMMEGATVMQALRRSVLLVRRSAVTSFAAVIIMFLIPGVFAAVVQFTLGMTARALDPNERKPAVTIESTASTEPGSEDEAPAVTEPEKKISIGLGGRRVVETTNNGNDDRKSIRDIIVETISQFILLPFQIFATSFTAIIVALLYIKTRQAGGESLKDLLEKFEEADQPRKKWQERVRQRLIQSGRGTSTSKP
ncbi:MAG TPA: protein kinase [Pyrinomonadaceae bacterium]|nr:protein kinase [Pyrinomonadaceae bacterium]HMP67055.1 protein kinase [Pyrinomonadaceae bacterium]